MSSQGTVFCAPYSTTDRFDIYLLKRISPSLKCLCETDESTAGSLYYNQPSEQKTGVDLTLLSGAPIHMNHSFDSKVWERAAQSPHIWPLLWEGRILFSSEVYETKDWEHNAGLQSLYWTSTAEVFGKMFLAANWKACPASHPQVSSHSQ